MQPNIFNTVRVFVRAITFKTIALVVFASLNPLPAAQSAYQIVKFDVPGAAATWPSAINDAGVIVGYYQTVNSSNEAIFQGFERTPDGQITTLTYPGTAEYNNYARGINAAGLIVGTYFNAGGDNQDTFTTEPTMSHWTSGTILRACSASATTACLWDCIIRAHSQSRSFGSRTALSCPSSFQIRPSHGPTA